MPSASAVRKRSEGPGKSRWLLTASPDQEEYKRRIADRSPKGLKTGSVKNYPSGHSTPRSAERRGSPKLSLAHDPASAQYTTARRCTRTWLRRRVSGRGTLQTGFRFFSVRFQLGDCIDYCDQSVRSLRRLIPCAAHRRLQLCPCSALLSLVGCWFGWGLVVRIYAEYVANSQDVAADRPELAAQDT